MQNYFTNLKIDGSNLKIAIVLPYFNDKLGLELLENTKNELEKNKVSPKNIKVFRVSGSLEIPFACQKITKKGKFDAIIALGVVIRGKTKHFDLVCETSYQGLMDLQLKISVPIIFGIITCENLKQAKERISKNGLNIGKSSAQAALIQATL